MNVDVYWNLHRKLWSVRDRSTGRVVEHAGRVSLYDVRFVVQAAGREKVRREGRKNVHAFARGNTEFEHEDFVITTPYRVTYNPYIDEGFVLIWNGERRPVHGTVPLVILQESDGRPEVSAFLSDLTPYQEGGNPAL